MSRLREYSVTQTTNVHVMAMNIGDAIIIANHVMLTGSQLTNEVPGRAMGNPKIISRQTNLVAG